MRTLLCLLVLLAVSCESIQPPKDPAVEYRREIYELNRSFNNYESKLYSYLDKDLIMLPGVETIKYWHKDTPVKLEKAAEELDQPRPNLDIARKLLDKASDAVEQFGESVNEVWPAADPFVPFFRDMTYYRWRWHIIDQRNRLNLLKRRAERLDFEFEIGELHDEVIDDLDEKYYDDVVRWKIDKGRQTRELLEYTIYYERELRKLEREFSIFENDFFAEQRAELGISIDKTEIPDELLPEGEHIYDGFFECMTWYQYVRLSESRMFMNQRMRQDGYEVPAPIDFLPERPALKYTTAWYYFPNSEEAERSKKLFVRYSAEAEMTYRRVHNKILFVD